MKFDVTSRSLRIGAKEARVLMVFLYTVDEEKVEHGQVEASMLYENLLGKGSMLMHSSRGFRGGVSCTERSVCVFCGNRTTTQ